MGLLRAFRASMRQVTDYDAIVVGAGPAGLSAADELSRRGRCLIIEQGPSLLVRDRVRDVLEGVGGAGLFSDGKHSLFPSASALWALPDRRALELAFAGVAAALRPLGVEMGEFPIMAAPPTTREQWQPRRYPSTYVSLAARGACIEQLWGSASGRLAGVSVVGARREQAGVTLVLKDAAGLRRAVHAPRLVVATGRWSPRWTRPWLEAVGASFAYRRVEFGVRLEAARKASIFAALPGVDGKLVWQEPGREFRTFCTCRDGEVVLGTGRGLVGYSGRADGPATGRSSFGLVVRIEDEVVGRALEPSLVRARQRVATLQQWLKAGAGFFSEDFGPVGARALHEALQRLCDWHPPLRDEPATVFSPCLEGVGDYPVTDGALSDNVSETAGTPKFSEQGEQSDPTCRA